MKKMGLKWTDTFTNNSPDIKMINKNPATEKQQIFTFEKLEPQIHD